MKPTRTSVRRRGVVLALWIPTLLGFSPLAAAQGGAPANHYDRMQEAASNDSWVPLADLRPSVASGLTRIEVRYASADVERRSAMNNIGLLRQEVATIMPGDKNWELLSKAISGARFTFYDQMFCEVNWGVYVYSKTGLARVISFQGRRAGSTGSGSPCGYLGIDGVYVGGQLPQLLEDLRRQGDLKFERPR